jgi:phosphoenolpyruvate synthase/pyruvate phosphate dikinase
LVGNKIYEFEIIRKLNIPIPNGFVVTSKFFQEFLRLTKIDKKIKNTHAMYPSASSGSVDKLFQPIQQAILETPIPQNLATELHQAYRKLSGSLINYPLNVFSSSTNERSIIFSGISGDANFVLKIKQIWSKTFNDPIAVAVQKEIKSAIVGKISTDNQITNGKLTKEQTNKLFKYCDVIQKYFYFPKSIEYAVNNDKIYVTRISPLTETGGPAKKGFQKILAKGVPVYPGIVTGKVRVLTGKHKNIKIKKGEIVVLSTSERSLFAALKNAKAVIFDSILPNSLNKIIYKMNFKIPTVEGIRNAAKIIQDGDIITVNGLTGEIYPGGLIY